MKPLEPILQSAYSRCVFSSVAITDWFQPEVLSLILQYFPKPHVRNNYQIQNQQFTFKCIILGDSNVGKTALLHRYVMHMFVKAFENWY